MERKPKISVTHYLNKKVKPIEDGVINDSGIFEPTGELMYPIYYYITIKRKTIHKPSKFEHYITEKEFENRNITFADIGSLNEAIRNEIRIISKTCELFLSDYDKNRVNNDIQALSNRGFNAKDEFINGLNSYIEFYTSSISDCIEKYTNREIERFLFSKMANFLDLSMFENKRLKFDFGKYAVITDSLFFEKNLTGDTLGLFYMNEIIYSAQMGIDVSINNKYGGNFPIIEWFKGDLKSTVSKILLNEKDLFKGVVVDLQAIKQKLNIDENYIKEKFIPLLDEILTPEYQIKNRFNF